MKKIVLLILALALLLVAYAPIDEGVSVPDKEPPSHLPTSPVEPSTTATHSPAPTPTKTPEPVPTLTPDEDIPDVMIDTTEKANSNDTLYEDDENIYYREGKSHGGDLLVINKSSGAVKKLAGDCHGFTFYDGWLYYYQMEGSPFTVESYDVETDAGNTIVSLAYPVSQIACYDGRIYFARMSEIILDSGEAYDNLYVTDLNGKRIKKIQEDAYSFCWYNDRMFYTEYEGPESGSLYEYNEDGKSMITSLAIDYFF